MDIEFNDADILAEACIRYRAGFRQALTALSPLGRQLGIWMYI